MEGSSGARGPHLIVLAGGHSPKIRRCRQKLVVSAAQDWEESGAPSLRSLTKVMGLKRRLGPISWMVRHGELRVQRTSFKMSLKDGNCPYIPSTSVDFIIRLLKKQKVESNILPIGPQMRSIELKQ